MMTVICDRHIFIVHATKVVAPALHDAQMAIYHVIIRIFRGKTERSLI